MLVLLEEAGGPSGANAPGLKQLRACVQAATLR